METKICVKCGENFKTTNSIRKYCSAECRERRDLEKRCLFCDKLFYVNSANRIVTERTKCCSISCSQRRRRYNTMKNMILQKKKIMEKYKGNSCVFCGGLFTDRQLIKLRNNASQHLVYCSSKCKGLSMALIGEEEKIKSLVKWNQTYSGKIIHQLFMAEGYRKTSRLSKSKQKERYLNKRKLAYYILAGKPHVLFASSPGLCNPTYHDGKRI